MSQAVEKLDQNIESIINGEGNIIENMRNFVLQFGRWSFKQGTEYNTWGAQFKRFVDKRLKNKNKEKTPWS